jgi:tetratricopeptide (TPR) repeat protein
MLKLIRAYRANSYWIRAHAEMGGQFQSLALVSIRKAVELEPVLEKVPAYLELQGHIESGIGKFELAKSSFQEALKIIADNPSAFNSKESQELRVRLKDSVDEIRKNET